MHLGKALRIHTKVSCALYVCACEYNTKIDNALKLRVMIKDKQNRYTGCLVPKHTGPPERLFSKEAKQQF